MRNFIGRLFDAGRSTRRPCAPEEAETVDQFEKVRQLTLELERANQHARELLERNRDLQQARDQVTSLLDSITEFFIAVDRQWRFIYVNQRVIEALGRPREEIIGRNLWELAPDAVETEFYTNCLRVMVEREAAQFQVYSEKRHRWFEVHAQPIEQGLSAYIVEITERKRAEEALTSSEATLRAFLESASQGVVAVDSRGAITLVNAKTEELFGYSREELLGRSLEVLLPESYRAAHTAHRISYFANPRVRPMGLGLDLAGRRKDGAEFPVEISLSYVGEGEGRLALGFITDITDRKRIEEQLRDTAKLESLGVLAGGIAHDFNNLLVGVMGNASLALEGLSPDSPARGMIEGVLRASERAAELIRQLLAYSGKGRFVIEPVNVSDLIRETIGLTQASISKNVELRLELAGDLPPVEADRSQLQQLVMNLVINGAEAVGENPGVVFVRTRVQEAAAGDHEPQPRRWVRLEVQDTGCGMDEATQARIFDPFFTTKFTGRGLGLAAVLGIVRGHRGVIDVRSAPGRGSTFTVLFPASNLRRTGDVVEHTRDLAGEGTILVVDDEEIVRSSARLALEHYGYTVLLASNGREAIELLRQRPDRIAAVVLDLTMPVMSGEEALGHIRQVRPGLPVILSSGYNEAEAVRRFHDRELAGFLQKPYSAVQLAEKIKSVIPGTSTPAC